MASELDPATRILKRRLLAIGAVLVSAISSDAQNVYVTLSAKELNPLLHVAVRASDEQAEKELQRAGATTVLTPYTYIGHRLAQSLLRPHVLAFSTSRRRSAKPNWTSRSSKCVSRQEASSRRRR